MNTEIMENRFYLARHPNRLNAKHPLIIEDFLEIAKSSKRICLKKMIEMTQDLYQNSLDSRYQKHLIGALFELKDRTKEGGARVYFLRLTDTEFVLGRAECKKETATNEAMLISLLDVLEAIETPFVKERKTI